LQCSCGFPLVSRWFPAGFPLVSRWFPAGFPLVSRWFPAGFPLAVDLLNQKWQKKDSTGGADVTERAKGRGQKAFILREKNWLGN
jgi:hypothetical protein